MDPAKFCCRCEVKLLPIRNLMVTTGMIGDTREPFSHRLCTPCSQELADFLGVPIANSAFRPSPAPSPRY